MNEFAGHVQDGKAFLGSFVVEYPGHQGSEPRAAAGFARPDQLDLSKESSPGRVQAEVRRVRMQGPVVRVELMASDRKVLEVETTRERCEDLGLTPGAVLWVGARQLRVFLT